MKHLAIAVVLMTASVALVAVSPKGLAAKSAEAARAKSASVEQPRPTNVDETLRRSRGPIRVILASPF